MTIYAKVNNAIVENIIVATPDFFEHFVDSTPGTYIETKEDGSIRKNYAGIGFSYDSTKDAFIPPQPYPSWILNESTCQWVCPVAYPDETKLYNWNETTKAWDEVT